MPDRPRPPVLLHVGYMKTASTWLQDAVFRNPTGGFHAPWLHRRVLNELVVPAALTFDAASARSSFEAGIAEAYERGLVPVVSNERLTGTPHTGGYDSLLLAQRLAEVFPGARVLLVIREQRGMLASSYKLYVGVGGGLGVDAYLSGVGDARARVPSFRAEHLEYHRLIEAYRKLFGEDNVLVLPYERLREDPEAYVRAIAAYAEARPPASLPSGRSNESLSAAATAVKRVLNRLFVQDPVNPSPLLPLPVNARLERALARMDRRLPSGVRSGAERRLSEVIARWSRGRFEASNLETERLTGLDLERYGYAR